MLETALAPGGPLHALTGCKQFILCKGKMPVAPNTLQVHDAHDPAIWIDAAEAVAMSNSLPDYGVGFVFTAADPFYFLDIDGALQADGATWSPTALELLATLPDAAVEVSQSGRGLHVFGRTADLPHGNKNISLGIELYTTGRFVALTGTNAIGDANTDNTAALSQVIAQYFPVAGSAGTPQEWTDGPVPEWAGPQSDNDIILKAMASKSVRSRLGGGASFADLWSHNVDALSIAFPDTEGERWYDSSSADAALAQHLAFWTGKDCERIVRIMNMSPLKRDKWEREDYIHRTVIRAVTLQGDVYNSGYRNTTPTPAPTNPTAPTTAPVEPMSTDKVHMREGLQFMSSTQQIEHFHGCTYIVDRHQVFCPDGSLLNPERFRSVYGGYIFTLDALNDKTTKNAWEAFTESQAIHYPKANSTCFRPQIEPGALVFEEGSTLVNTYVPVPTRRVVGDATRFLDHLAKLLPAESDREILLAYMAACIQHIGVKFKWAPLLQGIQGNGKTLFTNCVAAAIGRKYVFLPQPSDLDNKFNSWLRDRLFIGIEDIYVPDHKREIMETLKPMITGEYLQIQSKGVDQVTADVCANFMFNTNYRDAIRKIRTDRRFAIFFTAQQRAGDIERHGMGGDYFPKLYDWLKLEDGYAIVADYLTTYQIPEALNPSNLNHRAPLTTSTNEALAESLGGVEQEILEAIEIGRPGFCGGWISSNELNRLLESLRMTRAIPLNKRRELLHNLGFIWHPALTNGRLNNPLKDGSKPKIFIREDHPHVTLAAAAIGPAYQAAQTAPQMGIPGIDTGAQVIRA